MLFWVYILRPIISPRFILYSTLIQSTLKSSMRIVVHRYIAPGAHQRIIIHIAKVDNNEK